MVIRAEIDKAKAGAIKDRQRKACSKMIDFWRVVHLSSGYQATESQIGTLSLFKRLSSYLQIDWSVHFDMS